MLNPSNILPLPFHSWLLEQVQDAILFVEQSGQIISANQKANNLFEQTNAGLENIHFYFDFDMRHIKSDFIQPVKMKDGSNRSFLLKCHPIALPNNEQQYCIILTPSSSSKVKDVKRQMNDLIQGSYEGMVLHDQGIIIDCDETFSRMFGYTTNEMIRKNVFDLVEEKSYSKLKDMLGDYPESPYQMTGCRKDGSIIHVEILAHPYPFEGKLLRGALIRDVTERVEHEKRIEFMAYYDELTDLPNRAYFMKKLKEAVQVAKEESSLLAVHFLDIDYFKQINDTLGYVFGDKLLKAFSERLKLILDEHNFIARMSGDEFLILQNGIGSKQEAEQLAERILHSFKHPLTIDGLEIFSSVSIGISVFPENGGDSNELLKQADSAMNVSKANHRNHYKLFESSISKDFKAILTMETELRKALKENQLELYYQPQKNILTEEIVGLEALLRWNHPTEGKIPPSTFIPLAEKTGLIFEMGEWVLKEACRQNKSWQLQGYNPVIVGVNLSVKQFHDKHLVSKVKDILVDTGLEPYYLELEITESMAMSNEEDIIATIQALRDLGVHVSIDDFGTGYSSLKYLSQFPVSKLKIDRVFIDNPNRKQNEAIVKSIIHMSHSLNMKVIAEGVETEEQLQFLKNEKCDEIQGYYFSKPLPPNKFSQFLKTTTIV